MGIDAEISIASGVKARRKGLKGRSPVQDDWLRHGLAGNSPAINKVVSLIETVAAIPAPVLITGESGTGKELVARAIHRLSPQAGGPFIATNCAALPATLVSSELFGHEKGAFTGAVAVKIGRIEAAHNGTLFLDEIGDLPLDMQAHMLRVLQERSFERVGSFKSLPATARILSGTNVDLTQAVQSGRFREDLFYRLNVINIHVPPLRERGEDVEILAAYFLSRYAAEIGKTVIGFTAEARELLLRHSWPGNVRELENTIRRAVILAADPWIAPQDLGLTPPRPARSGPLPSLDDALNETEAALVRQTLELHGHNIALAAGSLGVSRATLYRLIAKHRLAQAHMKREPLICSHR